MCYIFNHNLCRWHIERTNQSIPIHTLVCCRMIVNLPIRNLCIGCFTPIEYVVSIPCVCSQSPNKFILVVGSNRTLFFRGSNCKSWRLSLQVLDLTIIWAQSKDPFFFLYVHITTRFSFAAISFFHRYVLNVCARQAPLDYLALLWALPTPQALLAMGLNWALLHMVGHQLQITKIAIPNFKFWVYIWYLWGGGVKLKNLFLFKFTSSHD